VPVRRKSKAIKLLPKRQKSVLVLGDHLAANSRPRAGNGKSLITEVAIFTSSFGCNFIMGFNKLHTKFKVASFSHCRNIKGKLQNFVELP